MVHGDGTVVAMREIGFVVQAHGLVGGMERHDGPGEREAFGEGVDAVDDICAIRGQQGFVAGGGEVGEVQVANQVEGGSLPAGGGERGGIARVGEVHLGTGR